MSESSLPSLPCQTPTPASPGSVISDDIGRASSFNLGPALKQATPPDDSAAKAAAKAAEDYAQAVALSDPLQHFVKSIERKRRASRDLAAGLEVEKRKHRSLRALLLLPLLAALPLLLLLPLPSAGQQELSPIDEDHPKCCWPASAAGPGCWKPCPRTELEQDAELEQEGAELEQDATRHACGVGDIMCLLDVHLIRARGPKPRGLFEGAAGTRVPEPTPPLEMEPKVAAGADGFPLVVAAWMAFAGEVLSRLVQSQYA